MREIANGIALWSAARTRETPIVTAAGREGQLKDRSKEKGVPKGKKGRIQDQYSNGKATTFCRISNCFVS